MSIAPLGDARAAEARGRRLRRSKQEEPPAPGLFGVRSWTKTRMVIALIFAVISIFPLFYLVSSSFQPTADILTSHPTLIPSHPTTQNYVDAWTENSFSHYFLNSMLVALATVV